MQTQIESTPPTVIPFSQRPKSKLKLKMSKRRATGSSSSASPEWIELPADLTANILQRLDAVDTLSYARYVCKTWWTVCKEPATWRVIELRKPQNLGHYLRSIGTDGMCRRAVDLSQGQSISIHVEDLFESVPLDKTLLNKTLHNETLIYISKRLPNLRRLSLENCCSINGRALARAVGRLVVLEELHLTAVDGIHPRRIETIGKSRPMLKSFAFNLPCLEPPSSPDDPEEDRDFLEEFEEPGGLYEYLEEAEKEGEEEEEDEGGRAEEEGGAEEESEEAGGGGRAEEESEEEYFEDDPVDGDESFLGSKYAEAIAQSMPNLRCLALRANFMRNDGIEAILDGCKLLESLDIRQCYRVNLSGNLGKRLQRIKDIKLPRLKDKIY